MSDAGIKISCIIPTFDRPEFLSSAVKSALAQSYPAFEIIAVNNGKTPVSLEPAIGGKVTVFNIPVRAGVAQARNFGATVAMGSVLAFLDDDDLWNPDYLKNVAWAFKSGSRIAVSRLDRLEGGKVLPWKNAHNRVTLNNILVYNPGITGTNLAIAREIFFQLGGFDPKLPPSEDKSLVLEALLTKISVTTLPENQAIQRIHGGERLIDSRKMAEGIFQFLKKYRKLMTRKQALRNWIKVYRYRSASGDKKAWIPFVAYYILLKLIGH